MSRAKDAGLHRLPRTLVVVTCVAAVGIAPAVAVTPNVKYRLVNMGNTDCDGVPGPDGEGFPYTINDTLQAVGEGCARAAESVYGRGFMWSSDNGIEDLGLCDGAVGHTGEQSYARWLSAGGGLAGFVTTTGLQDRRAYYWHDAAQACDLGSGEDCDFDQDLACHVIVEEESAARAVDGAGNAVGWYRPRVHEEAFLYADGDEVLCPLPDADSPFSIATALDEVHGRQTIAGTAGAAAAGPTAVALWVVRDWDPWSAQPCSDGALVVDFYTVSHPGYEIGAAWGVADEGIVVGLLQDTDPNPARSDAFLFRDWNGDTEQSDGELTLLTGQGTECANRGACARGGAARGVSSSTTIVGTTVDDAGELHGARWRCAWSVAAQWTCDYDDVHDLFDRRRGLAEGREWTVEELWGINEDGVLVGYAELEEGETDIEEPGVALVPLVATPRNDSGAVRVDVALAVPDAELALYFGCATGAVVDPGPPCGSSGTGSLRTLVELAPEGPQPVATATAGEPGTASFAVDAFDCAGGPRYFQVIDRTSCVISEVVRSD